MLGKNEEEEKEEKGGGDFLTSVTNFGKAVKSLRQGRKRGNFCFSTLLAPPCRRHSSEMKLRVALWVVRKVLVPLGPAHGGGGGDHYLTRQTMSRAICHGTRVVGIFVGEKLPPYFFLYF